MIYLLDLYLLGQVFYVIRFCVDRKFSRKICAKIDYFMEKEDNLPFFSIKLPVFSVRYYFIPSTGYQNDDSYSYRLLLRGSGLPNL
jgi:hypothetical protein